MLISRHWCVIPAGCHTKKKVKSDVGLDHIIHFVWNCDVPV
jgi:hypothetical protein